jgi:hypothetical protein
MTNTNTNYQRDQTLDDQELRQALEDEHYNEVATSVGETACGCVPEYIEKTEIEKHKDPIADFVKNTFNPDSIGFIEAGASIIIEPDNFLERAQAIQELFTEFTPKPSVGDNALALKQVVTLTEKLDKMSRQVPENFSGATLDDPKKYKANLMRKMELEEKHRAQIYRDNFGFNQLINLHYLTIEDFQVILDADIRNLRGILRSDNKPSDLVANKVNRYLESVDQYVVARTQSR